MILGIVRSCSPGRASRRTSRRRRAARLVEPRGPSRRGIRSPPRGSSDGRTRSSTRGSTETRARFDRARAPATAGLGAGDGGDRSRLARARRGAARSAHRRGSRGGEAGGLTGGRGSAEGEGEVDEGDDSSFERDDSSFEPKTPFGRRVWGIGGGSDGRGVMEAFAAGMVFFGESVAESVARAAEEAARGFRGGTFFSSSAAAAVNPWADGVNEWSGTGFNLLFLLWGYGIASERTLAPRGNPRRGRDARVPPRRAPLTRALAREPRPPPGRDLLSRRRVLLKPAGPPRKRRLSSTGPRSSCSSA